MSSDDYLILKRWKNPTPIGEWQPIQLTSATTLPQQHVMGLHNIMIWQLTLAENLKSLIERACQALPVTIDDKQYAAIHVTQSIDCLDPDLSQFKQFKNRNIGVEHYVLRSTDIGNANLFTIPDDGYTALFASETLRSRFIESKWTGLSFLPVETS